MNTTVLRACLCWAGILGVIVAGAGCETGGEDVFAPARLLYTEAETLEDQGLFSEATTKYVQLHTQYPGTRLATFSYLKLAEIHSKQSEWAEADINYRVFLNLNPKSHLTPYVLYRLLKVNHEKSFTGIIFKAREVDRDMEPNRRIILEFKRFFLLYPKSVYQPEVLPFFRGARETLAQHEMVVADFYFDRGQFNAAAGRYRKLLQTYPEYPQTDLVLEKLIEAYRENQQPDFAEEVERIISSRRGPPRVSGGAAPESAARPLASGAGSAPGAALQ